MMKFTKTLLLAILSLDVPTFAPCNMLKPAVTRNGEKDSSPKSNGARIC